MPKLKCTPKVGQECKTFGGALQLNARLILLFAVQIDFYAEIFVIKNNTNPDFVSVFVLFILAERLHVKLNY